MKTSEPLDIDWTARLDRATGQPLDEEPFTLVKHEWTAIGHRQRQATGHSRPSIEGGWPGRDSQEVEEAALVRGTGASRGGIVDTHIAKRTV